VLSVSVCAYLSLLATKITRVKSGFVFQSAGANRRIWRCH